MENNIKYHVHGFGHFMYVTATYENNGVEELIDSRDYDPNLLLFWSNLKTKPCRYIEALGYLIKGKIQNIK